MAALSLSCAVAAPALAQDGEVVMRRPLPRSVKIGPGTPTPTPTSTPDGGEDVDDTPVENDPTELCDGQPGSPEPIITNVAWVLEGYTTVPNPNGETGPDGTCVSKKPVYVCQATFACQVNGRNDAFTSVAPDSLCENYPGEVSYPGTGTGGGGPTLCPFPSQMIDGECRFPGLELPPMM